MKIPLEEHFPYTGLALWVLAIFYVTYFRKMLAQKRKVMYGNLLTFVFSLFAILILHLQSLQEEQYLESTYGLTYTKYKNQVFRYLGRKSLIRRK